MSVNVPIDINLSPDWLPVLQRDGWQAVHWSAVGDPRATDRTIMDWAVAILGRFLWSDFPRSCAA